MKLTPELAEFCGIHAGDGHLRKIRNELEVSGSFEEKVYYEQRVIPLFNKIFDTNVKGKFFPTKGTYGFTISRLFIRKTLIDLGIPPGNKHKIVSVPDKILNSKDKEIRRAFLRGIFDTDGCLYFNKKIYNKDSFKVNRNFYPTILFTTVSEKLAKGVHFLAKKDGFRCNLYSYNSKKETESLKYTPKIDGIKEMLNWMNLISPKNHVKVSRYEVWEKFGFCPSKTNYKQRLKILDGKLDPNKLYGPVA